MASIAYCFGRQNLFFPDLHNFEYYPISNKHEKQTTYLQWKRTRHTHRTYIIAVEHTSNASEWTVGVILVVAASCTWVPKEVASSSWMDTQYVSCGSCVERDKL